MEVTNQVMPDMARAMAFFGGLEDGPFVMVNLLKFKARLPRLAEIRRDKHRNSEAEFSGGRRKESFKSAPQRDERQCIRGDEG